MFAMKRLTPAMLLAVAVITASAVSPAPAHAHGIGWPWHSYPGIAYCKSGAMVGNMPAVRSRDEAVGTITGGGFVLGDPSAAPSVTSTPMYNQWITYRIRAYFRALDGSLRYYAGNWVGVWNYYTGGEGAYVYRNGSWQYLVNGDFLLSTGGSNAASIAYLPRGQYLVVGELHWGAIPGYSAMGPHWFDLGTWTCS